MNAKKWLSLALAALMASALLTGCGTAAGESTTPTEGGNAAPTESAAGSAAPSISAEQTKVNLAVLSGPTGIGAAKLLSDAAAGSTANEYEVTVAAAPDELTGKIISGDIDIAALSTNLAATLYQKTEGSVRLAAINTLGVLYILENGTELHSMADLKGKTIKAFGQGANPEYVLNYLLEQNGLKAGEDVTVEFGANEEIVAAMASGDATIAMLPVPAATTVLKKNSAVRGALDLTAEWNKAAPDSQLAMGCIVVRQEFAQQHPEAVQAFLEEYQTSVTYVTEHVDEAAALVAQLGIVASPEIAKAAIPQCNLVCITGEAMKPAISGYYDVLFAADPTSVGGALPDDAFYYIP